MLLEDLFAVEVPSSIDSESSKSNVLVTCWTFGGGLETLVF